MDQGACLELHFVSRAAVIYFLLSGNPQDHSRSGSSVMFAVRLKPAPPGDKSKKKEEKKQAFLLSNIFFFSDATLCDVQKK